MHGISSNLTDISRRHALRFLTLSLALVLSAPVSVRAEENSNATKAAAWKLGSDLSAAILLYAQKQPENVVNQFLSNAKALAKRFGIEIKPFPTLPTDQGQSYRMMVDYTLGDEIMLIAQTLHKGVGFEQGVLFEIAMKSNILSITYQPSWDQKFPSLICDLIKERSEAIHLPQNLWIGVINIVHNRRTWNELMDALTKMHQGVYRYYSGKLERGTQSAKRRSMKSHRCPRDNGRVPLLLSHQARLYNIRT